MSVPTFRLSTGAQIPFLSWGNGTGDARQTALESGTAAFKAGIRHIDTAQGYNNENDAGRAIKDSGVPREEIWITTKLSQKDGSPDNDPIPLENVRASVLGSLERLETQPNLILVHNPFVPPPGTLVKFWQELEKLKDSGELTADLGVSNFRPQDLEELLAVAKYKPTVNQLEYHPYVLTHLKPVLEICAKNDIVIESYGGLTPVLRHPTGGPLKPIIHRIASRLSEKAGEEIHPTVVLLLWMYAKGVVAVTASGNPDRIKNLPKVQEYINKGITLTAEEVKEVKEVGSTIHYRHYDEHMKYDFPAPDLPSQ